MRKRRRKKKENFFFWVFDVSGEEREKGASDEEKNEHKSESFFLFVVINDALTNLLLLSRSIKSRGDESRSAVILFRNLLQAGARFFWWKNSSAFEGASNFKMMTYRLTNCWSIHCLTCNLIAETLFCRFGGHRQLLFWSTSLSFVLHPLSLFSTTFPHTHTHTHTQVWPHFFSSATPSECWPIV